MNNCFIRFGNLPLKNRSKNQITGKSEKGVSAFPAYYKDDYIYYKSPENTEAIYNKWTRKYGNAIYMLVGDVIGYGSDNEPLVGNIKKVLPLKYNEQTKTFKVYYAI